VLGAGRRRTIFFPAKFGKLQLQMQLGHVKSRFLFGLQILKNHIKFSASYQLLLRNL